MPFLTRGGIFIAMVSTLFATPHTPTEIEMATLKAYSYDAAAHLHSLFGKQQLATKAEQMRQELYAERQTPPRLTDTGEEEALLR
jgi:hypothetical protein